jgi:hypothetical protein
MAIVLPTEKTKPKTDLKDYTILLYGEPKIGKSTWASEFPDTLFLATEPGLNALECYQIPISTWEEFLEACKVIATSKHQFKTIVIDTIDNLAKFCSDYICRKNNILHESDLEWGKGWSMVSGEFLRVLTKLALLPYGLVMISHAETVEIKTRTIKYNKDVPTLSKSFRKIVLEMADLILYAHTVQRKDKEGNQEEARVLETRASENWEAGNRTTFKQLPGTLDFSYQEFINAWNNSQNKGDVA